MFDFTEADDARPSVKARPQPQADPPARRDAPLSGAHVLALQQSAGNAAVSRMLARVPQPPRVIARTAAAEATTMSLTREDAQALSDDELFEAIIAVQDELDRQPDPELADVLAANLAVLEDERSSPERVNQSQPAEDAASPLIENALLSIGAQIGEQMWSARTDGVSTDPRSTERLNYALKLAHACDDVYSELANGDEPSGGEPEVIAGGLARLNNDGLRALGLDPKDFDNSESGYHAALYIDSKPLPQRPKCLPSGESFKRKFAKDNPELAHLAADLFPDAMAPETPAPPVEPQDSYVLANRGTDLVSGKDWKENLMQGLGNLSPQYDQGIALGRAVYAAVKGHITFAGHSLGGGIASAQALATGAPALTFNAAGLDDANAERLVGPESTDPAIAAYYVGGEALSSLQDPSLFMYLSPIDAILASVMDPALGERVELSSGGLASALSPGYALNQHRIGSVITALEEARDASLEGGD